MHEKTCAQQTQRHRGMLGRAHELDDNHPYDLFFPSRLQDRLAMMGGSEYSTSTNIRDHGDIEKSDTHLDLNDEMSSKKIAPNYYDQTLIPKDGPGGWTDVMMNTHIFDRNFQKVCVTVREDLF